MRHLLPMLSLLLLAGCPKLTLQRVSLADASWSEHVTLVAEIDVTEPDETSEEDTPAEGRGLLALRVPLGWTVRGARLTGPTETVPRALVPVPQTAVLVAERFPGDEGAWWAFASQTIAVPQGSWAYRVEVDVVPPRKSRGGALAVVASQLSDDLTEIAAPLLFDLALTGKKATLKPRAGLSLPLPEPQTGSTGKASAG